MNKQNEQLEDFGRRAVRHGEIMLIPVESIPTGAVETFSGKEYIVGHSETGHHHVAVGDVSVFTFNSRTFLRVNTDSQIKHLKSHEVHETKPLLRGWFEITVKTAYDYFKKRREAVRD